MEINIKTPDQIDNKSFFQSSTAKMMMVGILTLVLLIPLFFVQDLITERSIRQKEVVSETGCKKTVPTNWSWVFLYCKPFNNKTSF